MLSTGVTFFFREGGGAGAEGEGERES